MPLSAHLSWNGENVKRAGQSGQLVCMKNILIISNIIKTFGAVILLLVLQPRY